MKKVIPGYWSYILIVLTVILLALLFLLLIGPINWQKTNEFTYTEDVNLNGYGQSNYLTVMLDNATVAMPQAGLEKAVVVYEALIEGGFTRLMAVFNTADLPDKIGPVRSARPYFLTLANDWQGTYWHAGGSPQALNSLKKDDYSFTDINEISYQGIYFYRDHTLINPHNLFTRPELINRALDSYEIKDKVDYLWEIKDELAEEYRTEEDKFIHVPYTQGANDVYWHYDREQNVYNRFIGEDQEYFTNNDPVTAKNVIVLIMQTRLIDTERLGMDVIGSGLGYLFRDGQKQEIVWKKDNNSSLKLLFGQRPIQLNYGQTWVQILPQYLNLEYN
ncbi:MAG: DUF3048 domain-containing protein [Candidatus Komeilibacteria bacterium]